jgi:hypothetical protein
MNGLEGAKVFWIFVEGLYNEYPELFSLDIGLFGGY